MTDKKINNKPQHHHNYNHNYNRTNNFDDGNDYGDDSNYGNGNDYGNDNDCESNKSYGDDEIVAVATADVAAGATAGATAGDCSESIRDKQATQKEIAQMLRVNHAGEYGALAIYEGQNLIFGKIKEKTKINEIIETMRAQEETHAHIFDDLLRARKIRPTALSPLWHIGGVGLGAMTALLGDEAAFACTQAIEEVIGDHYQKQYERLCAIKGETQLAQTIAQCRDDEQAHCDLAIEHQSKSDDVFLQCLKGGIKTICKLSIFLSKRL